MQVSVYSIIMSVLCGTLVMLVLHLFRRKNGLLKGFGVGTLLLLYALCMGRLLFAVEFPFAQVFVPHFLYDNLFDAVYINHIQVGPIQVNLLSILLVIWIMGAVILLGRFIVSYSANIQRLNCYAANKSERLDAALGRIQTEHKCKMNISVFLCPEIQTPMGMGIFNKKILLRDDRYTDDELYYILKHEYTHFLNHDLIVKLLVHVFCCLLWWNPASYLLQKDIAQMLEIKCDLRVTQHFQKQEKMKYLSVIVQVLKGMKNKGAATLPAVTTQLVRERDGLTVVERFKFVSDAPPKKCRRAQLLFLAFCFAFVMASYSVILQPAYDPPVDEIVTGPGVYDLGEFSGYVLKHRDGTYAFIDEAGESTPMRKENVEIFLSTGYEIREE